MLESVSAVNSSNSSSGTQAWPTNLHLSILGLARLLRTSSKKMKMEIALIHPFSSSGARLSGTRLKERRKGI